MNINKKVGDKMKFSQKALDHLSVLYRHERHNSYVYAYISNYLNVIGFKNLSQYYRDWSNHEKEHSELVQNFANSNNIVIDVSQSIEPLGIDLYKFPITKFAEVTLEVENKTTDLYNKYLEIGEEDDNPLIRRFALDFILEQQEETGKAYDIHDSIMNIGDNKAFIQLFDSTYEVGG